MLLEFVFEVPLPYGVVLKSALLFFEGLQLIYSFVGRAIERGEPLYYNLLFLFVLLLIHVDVQFGQL